MAAAAICSRAVSAPPPRRHGGAMGRAVLPLWALLALGALRAPAPVPGVAAGGPAGERGCRGVGLGDAGPLRGTRRSPRWFHE